MSSDEIKYTSDKRQGFFKIFIDILKEFPKANSLGYRLALRNIKAKYRKSVFGVFWALLPPIATSVVWIFLRGQGVVDFKDTGVSYSVFVVTGTFLWQLFSKSIQVPVQSIRANKSILTKINFPREALFYGSLYEIIFHLLITLVVVGSVMVYHGAYPGIEGLLFIPFLFLLIIMGLTFSLLILPVSSLYSDVQFALPTVLQFLMYLTPVIYPKPEYTGIGKILEYNPITPFLSTTRNLLLGIEGDSNWTVLILLSIAVLTLFFIGIILSRLTMEILIERMGS